jgi:hypothetical protein
MFHPRTDPAGNGAPQTVALLFLAVVFLMLLLPFAQISVQGTTQPALLLFMVRTADGFNPFALGLLLAPIAGVLAVIFGGTAWRLAGAAVGLVSALLIPLTLAMSSRELESSPGGALTSLSPGVGTYVIIAGYLLITIVEGASAFRHWRATRSR